MRYVHVLDLRVVVLVRVSGQEMHPVLASMEVMGDVEMLVAMVEVGMVMATSRLCLHGVLPPVAFGAYCRRPGRRGGRGETGLIVAPVASEGQALGFAADSSFCAARARSAETTLPFRSN
jgi:hypothetical protein